MKILLQQDFKALFDNTLDAILVADDNGVHLAANPAACQLLKAPESAIVGHTIADFICPKMWPQSNLNWQRFLETGQRTGEADLICGDGSHCRVEFRAKANFLPGQHLSVLHDITERKRAEAALAEANRQTNSIMESVSDMVLAFDHDWNFLYGNPQSEAILRRPPHEFLGRNLWEEYPETRGTVFEESYLKAQRENEPVRFQGYNSALEMWMEVHVYPSKVGVTVYIRDINDRKQAEDNLSFLSEAGAVLSSSLEQDRIIANLAKLTISYLADWCAIDVMEAGQIKRLAVVHKDPNKLEFAREFQRLYPPILGAAIGVPQVLRTGQPILLDEITDEMLVASAPDPKWLEMVRSLGMKSLILVPLVAAGQTIGAMTLVREQSGRRYNPSDLVVAQELGRRAGGAVENGNLFRAKTQALQVAEMANRAKDEFLETLSHELRTPLHAILGWSHLISDPRVGEPEKIQGLEAIQRNAQLQARLVEDIFDVCRIMSGKMKLEVRPVDLAEIIEAAVDSAFPSARDKEIRLQRFLDTGISRVSGDADRLQQVVWNLLANAIKFTPQGGWVQIRLGQVDSQVEIVVTDNGMGIDAEVLSHVFERFRQADASSTRKYGGLGLGLSLVRHIIEAHGGLVEVQSAGAEQGATFTVKLPVRVENAVSSLTGH